MTQALDREDTIICKAVGADLSQEPIKAALILLMIARHAPETFIEAFTDALRLHDLQDVQNVAALCLRIGCAADDLAEERGATL